MKFLALSAFAAIAAATSVNEDGLIHSYPTKGFWEEGDSLSEVKASSQEMADYINFINTTWQAHDSPRFSGHSLEVVAGMCGSHLPDHDDYKELPEREGSNYEFIADDIPEEFDARENWKECESIGHIRDQSSCGSCWAFGATEAFNDRLCIAKGFKGLLSPEDTVSCCNFLNCFSQGCNGGNPSMAWKWFSNTGVVSGGDYSDEGKTDSCLPYSMAPCSHHSKSSSLPDCPKDLYPTPSCSKECSNNGFAKSYSDDKHKADSSYSIRGVKQIQTEIMTKGPVTAAFIVYSDFPSYKSGVYQHTEGTQLGGHAIKIIGWGVEDGVDYWTVVNSWNTAWGDNGTFKILRGSNHCNIEGMVSAGTI